MAVTLREIYLNQLAGGIDDPNLRARVEAEEGKLDEGEVSRARDIGGATDTSTRRTSVNTTRYNELLQEAQDSEDAAPSKCPTVNWEVKYFDKETRQYETIVIPAKTGYGAEKIAQTLTNGGFYAANHASETTGGSWTSSRDAAVTDSVTGETVEGEATAAQTAGEVLPESIIGPVPPDLERQIIGWVQLARGWGLGPDEIDPETGLTSDEMLSRHIANYGQRQGVQVTPEQVQIVIDWQDYATWQANNSYAPVATSASEYAINYERWLENMPYYQAGYTQDHIDSWDVYKSYASKYGDLADMAYNTLDEYLTNWDQSQQQLQSWINEAGSESFGFTDDQRRDYNLYWDYYNEYAPTGTAKPVDIGDFYNNFNYFQQQLIAWQRQGEVGGGLPGTGDGTTTGQTYMEQPMLSQQFSTWMHDQEEMSGAFSQFVESEYPSLRGRFDVIEGRMPEFGSREAAEEHALGVEGRWKSWLTGQTPELEEQYWSQRPQQRGEKLFEYAPAMRAINW